MQSKERRKEKIDLKTENSYRIPLQVLQTRTNYRLSYWVTEDCHRPETSIQEIALVLYFVARSCNVT